MAANFLDAGDFSRRIAAAIEDDTRPLVLLLGSGVCVPNRSNPGVPGASALMEDIRAKLGDDWVPVDSYQLAFEQLIKRRGQDAANKVIRNAVLQARIKPASDLSSADATESERLEGIEEDSFGWHLPGALKALAALAAHHPKKIGPAVLTTNFDPLIEVALSRLRVPFFSSALHSDGSLLQISGSGVHVVHLHGFWRRGDTLHTQRQLKHDRPKLAESLREIVKNSTVAILGYGGWDDQFMTVLDRIVAGDSTSTDLLWAFHETDVAVIGARYRHVISKLEGLESRGLAHFYKGVSADAVLPDAFSIAMKRKPAQDLATYLDRVERVLGGRADYAGLDAPWGTSSSLGDYVSGLRQMSPLAAVKAGLFAADYLLPRLERQGIHRPPVRSSEFGYVRQSLELAMACAIGQQGDTELLSEMVSRIGASCEHQSNELDRMILRVALFAICAVLANASADDCYALGGDPDFAFSSQVCTSKAIHIAARILHDDDGALWGYISRRILGGRDHLERFC
jgi:hypothetical protein